MWSQNVKDRHITRFFIYVVNYCYFCAVANGDSQIFTKFLKYFTFLFVYIVYMLYICTVSNKQKNKYYDNSRFNTRV